MKRLKKAEDIKVAVIGYGGAGRGHVGEIKRAGMTVVAVCDSNKEQRKAAEQNIPGVETYTSLAAMLERSDANLIGIITPHNLHARQAIQCLKAGRHVVCEKPFAITTEECDRMIAAARKNKVMVSAYHNRHWDGWIMEAVKRIRRGVIGDVVRIEAHMGGYYPPGPAWRSSKSISGGILYDWGVHLLEYALQLIDADIDEVSGFAKTGFWAPKSTWKNDTNEDEALAVVRFKSGQWLQLGVSSIDSNPKNDRGWLEITGTNGTYIMSGGSYRIITSKNGKTVTTAGSSIKSEHWRYYRNVADHLVKGTKLVITGEWARRPIHILDLADKSARLGKALKAKYN